MEPGIIEWSNSRRGPLAASAVIVVACILQAPGRIAADTKLDLALAPLRFLGRTLRLWQPEAAFGHIQNQSIGYLFPMGPFFAVGDAVGVPMWLVQRLWMAALLVVALWGALRVAEALAIGSAGPRLAGAAAYALSPAMVVVIGSTSGGQLPAALLPWALLPLIRGAAIGSPRRAAARSALAVAAMGGINAASTLGVLVLPAVWLATRRGQRAGALLRWWLVMVPIACLWWLIPLVLQVRYGTDFLPYTEGAGITTATTSATEALRGTGYWLSRLFAGGTPWLPGGWALASVRVAILASVAVAAGGLWGIARRDIPERTFLVGAVAVGFVAVVAGYAGPLGGGLSGTVRDLLDGPLGAFRNVTKFEPVLRLPLALGLAHLLGAVALPRLDAAERIAAGAVVAALIAAAAWPLSRGQIVPPGSFRQVPSHWEDAAGWLRARGGEGRALLVPSSAFAEYDWGRPLDEPMQALARSPWAVRNLVPLGSDGLTRLLDEIDARLARGDAGPGFAVGLGRAGIRHLLVRNDLDPARTAAPSPAQVRDALAMAPGLRLARSFGPTVPGRVTTDRLGPTAATRTARYRALDVYEVADWAGPVAAYPATSTLLSGGPESVFDVADRDAITLTGDDPGAPPAADGVVTDGLTRRDVDFGEVRLNASYALTSTEPAPRTGRPPRDRLPLDGIAHQSTIEMTGAVTLRASSYGPPSVQLPELQPYAAFDGDDRSAWVTHGRNGALRQWLQIAFSRPIDPGKITVRPLDDPRWSRITRIRVTTSRGAVTSSLANTGRAQTIAVPRGPSRAMRIEIVGVAGLSAAGIREIAIPGVEITRSLRVPTDQAGDAGTTWHLHRAVADPHDATRGDEEPRLQRIISTREPVQLAITGTARARPGDAVDALLAPPVVPALSVSASSTWQSLPAFAARQATDGDVSTGWVADPAERTPALTLRWAEPRLIDRIDVIPLAGPVLRPTVLRLLSPDGERRVPVPASGQARFEGLRTTTMVVEVLETARLPRRMQGLVTPGAPSMAELRVPALADLAAPSSDRARTIDLPCGQGPPLLVDGRPVPTRAHGTVAALETMRSVSIEACESVSLAAGKHTIDGAPDGPLVVDELVLAPDRPSLNRGPAPRPARIVRWQPEHREIAVGRGGATSLVLTENFNEGWTARLDGRALRPIRVDGWRQGFVVPPGAPATVSLTFGPGRTYAAGLAVGAVALVLLVVAARRRGDDSSPPAEARRAGGWVAVAGALATGFLAGGPVVILVAAGALVARRWATAPLVAGLSIAAGAIAVAQPGRLPAEHAGAFSPVAQALAVLAVAALVLTLAADE